MQLPLARDVDLGAIAYLTEGFSGADLQALLSDAQLAAVHEHLSSVNSNEPGKMPVITDGVLKSIASKARPSVSESEKQRLYGIYSQFLDAKRSVAGQVFFSCKLNFFFRLQLVTLVTHPTYKTACSQGMQKARGQRWHDQ